MTGGSFVLWTLSAALADLEMVDLLTDDMS